MSRRKISVFRNRRRTKDIGELLYGGAIVARFGEKANLDCAACFVSVTHCATHFAHLVGL